MTVLPRQFSKWCLSVLIALALFPFPAAAQDRALRDVVADVKIIGNKKTPIETILRYIHTRPGMDFNAATLTDDIGRLSSSRLFKRIPEAQFESSPRGVTVTFLVVEYPNRVQEVVFKGANHVSKKDLESATRIRKGMPLDPASNKSACLELQNLLKKKGRYFANVTLDEGDKETDTRVVFNVTEGPIVRVQSIRFEGVENAHLDALKALVRCGGCPLTITGKFAPELFQDNLAAIEKHYRDKGYPDVKVNRELEFSKDFQWVDIAFHIHEGSVRYYALPPVPQPTAEPTFPPPISFEQVSSIIQLKRGYSSTEPVSNGDAAKGDVEYDWRRSSAIVSYDIFPFSESDWRISPYLHQCRSSCLPR